MPNLGAPFWPAIWWMIGGGAALTCAVCLIVAIVPAPHWGWGVRRTRASRARRRAFRLAHHHAHA